jgi:hypothetical protein
MDANDVYKLRAEEFERSFYDLRRIEWNVVFQLFAGYAAIVIGYWQWHVAVPTDTLPSCLCIVAAVFLWVLSLVYSWLHETRLHYTRNMQNLYLDKLHGECKAEMIKKDEPPLPRWYAFFIQQLLSIASLITIIVFACSTRPH